MVETKKPNVNNVWRGQTTTGQGERVTVNQPTQVAWSSYWTHVLAREKCGWDPEALLRYSSYRKPNKDTLNFSTNIAE